MDEIILKVLDGTATAHEKELVREWRARSITNERSFQELGRVWQLTGLASPLPRDHKTALAEILGRGVRPPPQPIPTRPERRRRLPWGWEVAAMAASLAAGLGLAQVLLHPPALERGSIEVVTAAGEKASVLFQDGTVLRLGPESRVTASDAPDSRQVTLEGDAYFAVAKDPNRPFVIRTEGGEAVVLGTRFEIRARGGELLVAVLEGRVEVTAAGERMVLEAGDVGRAGSDLPPTPALKEDMPSIHEWLGTFAAYQATPLREVARELRERFGLHVVFADSSLADRTLTAWFADSDLENMVSVICRVTDVNCTHSEGTLTIRR